MWSNLECQKEKMLYESFYTMTLEEVIEILKEKT